MTSHASSRTPRTTSGCSACGSAPTSTPSCTRSAAASTPSAGWGRTDETWNAKEELAAYGARAGLVRARRPRPRDPPGPDRAACAGCPLTEVDRASCAERWQPGVTAAADDRRPRSRPTSRTTVDGRDEAIHFQEYWIRHRRRGAGARRRAAASRRRGRRPGWSRRSTAPTWCSCRPSNPIVSIGPIVAVPGIARSARRDRGPRRRRLADHRRGGGARHGGPAARRPRHRDQRGGRRARTTARARRRAARRLARRHRRRRRASSRSRQRASRPGPSRSTCATPPRPTARA